MAAAITAPKTDNSTPSFNFDALHAGLASANFSAEEWNSIDGVIRRRTAEYSPKPFGGEGWGFISQIINMFVFGLQSLSQNFGAIGSNFSDWLGARGSDTANFGWAKSAADASSWVYLDLIQSPNPKIRSYAALISGSTNDGSPAPRDAWNVVYQLRATTPPPVNPGGLSLNLNDGTPKSEKAVIPPTVVVPPVPDIRTQALTR